ncbi:MAG: hypothetical protein M1161_03360 [Candidatus Thermoplasmatota archaeon]|nr:hypothetical protein [Candidatus Thermoplasmatota archaeon]
MSRREEGMFQRVKSTKSSIKFLIVLILMALVLEGVPMQGVHGGVSSTANNLGNPDNSLNGADVNHSVGTPYKSQMEDSLVSQQVQSETAFSNLSWKTIGPTEIPNATGKGGPNASGKISAFALDPTNPEIMYAGGGPGPGNSGPYADSGAFKTTDGGKNWTRIDNGLMDTYVCSIWVDPSDPSILLLGTWFTGLYRSTDGGLNWTLVYSTQHVTSITYGNGEIYATSESGIISSSNGGLSWKLLEQTSQPASVVQYSSGILVAGTDGGQVVERNGTNGSWTTILNVNGYWVWSIAINSTDTSNIFVVEFYSYNSPNLYETKNGGKNWTLLTVGGWAAQYVAFSNDGKLLVGVDGALYDSSDSGTTFSQLPISVDVRIIVPLSGGSIFVGSDQGLFEGLNNGTQWKELSASISASLLYGLAISGSTMLTAVQDFSQIASFDGGGNWTQMWQNSPYGEGGMVYVNPENPELWYAFNNFGFFSSSDGGRTFSSTANMGVPEGPAQDSIAIDPENSNNVFVGTSTGVFLSHSGGIANSFFKTSWPFTNVTLVVVSSFSNDTIFVGTQNGSLFLSESGGSTWKLSLSPGGPTPLTLSIDPMNSSTLLVGFGATPPFGGIWISTNGGNTFSKDNTGLIAGDGIRPEESFVQQITFEPNSSIAAAATSYGIYISYAGGAWIKTANNLSTQLFTGVEWKSGYAYSSTFGEGIVRTVSPVTYSVNFEVAGPGLPSGDAWFVNVTGLPSSGPLTNRSYTLDLPNGAYSFTVNTATRSYISAPPYPNSTGSFSVNGSGVNESLSFLYAPYTVTFMESGLPSTSLWAVTLNGARTNSTSNEIVFFEPNGTYNYSIGLEPGFAPINASGTVTVNGKSLMVNVSFVEVLYNVTFMETGLPAGSNWSVGMENRVLSSKTDSITFEVPNGTYSFTAFTVNSYEAYPTNGNLTVNGSSVSEQIKYSAFGKFNYLLFNETGLPNGTRWSVIVSFGNTLHNETMAISDNITAEYVIPNRGTNSTYWFRVTAVFGYAATPSEGNVTTNGMANYTVNIAFSRVDYLSGTISPKDASLFIDGQLITTTNGTYNVTLKIGQTYQTEVTSLGYETSYGNVTVTNGTPIVTAYSISLVKVSKPVSLELVVIISVIIVAIIAAAVVAMVTRNRVKRA